jgi:hypothetical protein
MLNRLIKTILGIFTVYAMEPNHSDVENQSIAQREQQRVAEEAEKARLDENTRRESARIAEDEQNQRDRTQAFVQNKQPPNDPTMQTKMERDAQGRADAEQGNFINEEQRTAYLNEQDRIKRVHEERAALARREKITVAKGADRIPSDRGLEELIMIHGAHNVFIGDVSVADVERKNTGEDEVARQKYASDEKLRQEKIDKAGQERDKRKREDEDLLMRDEIDKPLISQNGAQMRNLGGFEDKVRLAENVDKRPVNQAQIDRNRQDGKPMDNRLASPMAEKAVGETRGEVLAQEAQDKQAAQDKKNAELERIAANPADVLESLQDSKDGIEKDLDSRVEFAANRVKAGADTAEAAAESIFDGIPLSDRRATKLEIEKRIKDRVDKLNAPGQ